MVQTKCKSCGKWYDINADTCRCCWCNSGRSREAHGTGTREINHYASMPPARLHEINGLSEQATGDFGSLRGATAATIGPGSYTTRPTSHTMGATSSTIGFRSYTVGATASTIGSSASTTIPTSHIVGPTASMIGPTASTIGPTASTIGDTESKIGGTESTTDPTASTIPATALVGFGRQTSRLDEIQREIDQIEADGLLKRIMEQWETSKTPFIDDSFRPIETSLYYNGKPEEPTNTRIEWLRISQIRTQDNSTGPWVVVRNPKATDIEQGILGNCWFVSALSVVAERPQLIDKLLVSREISPAGVYQVRLFHDGHWNTVTIDDYLPCDRGCLIYSQARRRQLWVPLIEKAAAKLHGCYEALIAGHSIESLRMLTGAPCETLVISELSEDDLWVILLSCYESNFLFGASSGSGETTNDAEFEGKGLRKKHAYSVLDIQEVNGQRLIKLKNPWARFGWKGDWCATSFCWELITDAEKRAKMLEDCDVESIFWMCLGDFRQYFNAVDVCRLRSDWDKWDQISLGCHLPMQRLFEKRGNDRVANCVKVNVVTVKRATEVEMMLQQSSVRQASNLSLVDLGVVILRGDVFKQRCSTFAENKRNIRLFSNLHTILDPGVYSIVRYSFGSWHSIGRPTYSVLSIYSRFSIETVDHPMRESILRDALIAILENRGERTNNCEGVTSYYLQKGWCGMMLMVENRSHDLLHVQCICQDSVNVVSSRGALLTVDCIPALSRQLIIVLTQVEVYERYSISHRLELTRTPARGASSQSGLLHSPELEGVLHTAQKL